MVTAAYTSRQPTASQSCGICGEPITDRRPYRIKRRKYCSFHCTGIATTRRIEAARTERFWSHVDKNGPTPEHRPELGPCWLWTGHVNSSGYGLTSIGGRGATASRVAYIMTYGEPPADKPFALHECDNSICVRPDHLYAGDHAQNMADMANRGRSASHERQHAAKLTEEQVAAIRATLGSRQKFKNGEAADLARRYDVSTSQIWRVAHGQAWR